MDTSEFLRAQRENLPILLRKEHVEGKTFIITGSNHGIGREAARHVVRIGAARVILAVRSISKGEEAKAWIESTTGIKGVAQVWHLDTTDWQTVRAFANRSLAELDRIDGFVQNAAVTVGDHELNKEGYELSIAGNVIATLMLAFHLLPRMCETAKKYGGTPHLVFLTTGLAFTQPDAMELVDHEGGAFAALNRKGESPFKPSPKRYAQRVIRGNIQMAALGKANVQQKILGIQYLQSPAHPRIHQIVSIFRNRGGHEYAESRILQYRIGKKWPSRVPNCLQYRRPTHRKVT